jgi:glycosyltransferase involved in cell wall biosynthesis
MTVANRARPRLVHVTTTDISLALLLGPQLRAFADAGFEVIGASAPGPHVEQLHEWGIRHVALRHATRSMAPHRDVAALGELRSLFRELQPAIAHTHNPKPGVYGRLAARAARVPVVVNTVHGLYALPGDSFAKRAVVYGLERIAATCSDAELVQNPEDVATLTRLGIDRDKLTLLGNGVDLDRFHPTPALARRGKAVRKELGIAGSDVLCLLVGRLVAEKGYREVFAAARALEVSHPNVRIVIAGPRDDAKSDAITAEEIAAATASGVVFAGMRDDVEALYAAADLYVLASHREGFPRSAMEAAAMGVPIVATDIRGCRQVVDHERTGLLVPVRQSVALVGAISVLSIDPARRKAMAAAAMEKAAAEFDDQRVVDITLATYERLLAQKGPAAA